MNETLESIKNRRSIRKFEDKELTKQQIEEIIESGRLAPSARNDQNWKFIAVTNKELIKEMSDYVVNIVIDNPKYSFVKERKAIIDDPILYSAPAVIFIVAEEDDKWSTINCSLAAENMMIYAHSIGIGSCFIGMARFVNENQELVEKLKVPQGCVIQATLVFGYADEKPEFKERNKDNVTWID
jgi:nitroreductase